MLKTLGCTLSDGTRVENDVNTYLDSQRKKLKEIEMVPGVSCAVSVLLDSMLDLSFEILSCFNSVLCA